MKTLSLYINNELAYEYDRATLLSDSQQAFLDKMDADMARGIRVSGETISEPDQHQRATFITLNLIRAMQQEDEAKIAVSCAYLASRLPHVVEVRASDQDGGIGVEFIEEH